MNPPAEAQVTIEPLGETVPVGRGQTILDACLRAGIPLPYACGHGLCGTCKVSVLDGMVDHGDASSFALLDVERADGKALACSARPLGEVVIEADVDEDEDAERHPVADFRAVVADIAQPTPDIRVLTLDVPGLGLRFQAGQYVNVAVPGCGAPRAFSLAGPPSQWNRLELHVRLVPGGQATTWLHQSLAPGATLDLSGPYGRFFVRKSAAKPLLFLAGGSGLSSPKSMILDLLDCGWEAPITLIHGVRRPQDLYFADLFGDLAARHDNLRYVPAISAPEAGDVWDGERGFVHEVAERLYGGRFVGNQAYLCGPPLMIEACIGALMKGRLFERDIFTEKFVTAADGAVGLARSPLFKRL